METGFSECFSIKALTPSNLPSDKAIVLIIVDKELSGKPESDILYIGRTKKPVKRIFGGYLGGYGGKNTKKINKMLLDGGYLEKVAISWMATDKPRIMQETLLEKYKAEHGQLPIWNRKKKPEAKPKEAPAFKRKRAPALKTKLATAPKAATTNKAARKPKAALARKPAASMETAAKAETPKKEETGTGASEKAGPSAAL